MSKEYRTEEKPPSEIFVDSIDFGVGSAYMECGWCGREHFCPETSYDQDDDWAEQCQQAFKDNPEGVVLHYDSDGILGKQLNGLNFVVDCPCNGLRRFENFIWNERNTIRNYLKARINQEYEWAEQEKTRNKLAGFENKDLEKFF